ncbi:MAG: TonB-dependent receptor [Gemmatimonadetes bacterium]|nr:TonB-dependent receptor [Gemmatimonadota bacterium]MYC00081.1 TonB-dependent receptor [Gemmatimonadota bacterium]MYI45223.1 TonB-dependent receptor [Gemmatimonadota bacterium]
MLQPPIHITAAVDRTILLTVVIGLAVLPSAVSAQHAGHQGEIEGVVRDSVTGEPLAGATVAVIGSGTRAVTHGDGTFHLTDIGEGEYRLRVERLGYHGTTVEVTVEDESAVVVIALVNSPIALQGMVVTATLSERRAAEALRPVGVMAGDELQRQMESTVAATLASMPGLAAASMGPTVTQPVIRGLSGDRVLMLEDGTRVGDVSNSGSDHATALDPASARRIEVVRGPGALLYGGNALGGVINVIRDDIPSNVPHHATGAGTLQTQSVTGSLAGSATTVFGLAERMPVRMEAAMRRGGDLKTPVGTLLNTDGETLSGGAGASFLTDWGHVGASVRGYRNDYGIPGGFVGGHEAGVRIEMLRGSTRFQAMVDDTDGHFRDFRFDASYTWYEHREIEPPDILATIFTRRNLNGDLLARHGQWGPFTTGALGVRVSWEDFGFGGGLYTPDTRRTQAAAYFLEEMDLDPLLVSWGLRYDLVGTNPRDENTDSDIGEIRDRSFHSVSGSVGALYNAGPGLTLGASVARAYRSPDINELYSEGPHLAAYSFEVGNPSLEGEIGRGLDVFMRFESGRLRMEAGGFHNDIKGYVYGEDTGELSRVLLPIYQFRSNHAVFRGIEASVDVHVGGGLAVEGVFSSVRGSLKDTGDPLPLVPPHKGHAALKYERPRWWVRGEAEVAARQERVGEFETPTDGYTILNASAGVRLTLGGRLNVLTVSLDNATDTEYRNHLSRVKDIMPEAGRGLSLTYRVVF